MKVNKHILLALFSVLILTCNSCFWKKKQDVVVRDLPELLKDSTITAATLYGSTSYFLYKMQPMGYEYDLIEDFAEQNGLKLIIKVADSVDELLEMLYTGATDVIAYPIQVDKRTDRNIIYCGHENLTTQVLVQRSNKGDKLLNDVTQLIGREVYVNPHTRSAERIHNLNKELGGGVIIREIPKDSANVEDLIEMISKGDISFTICDDNIARLNKTYFWNIDVSLPVSFNQRSSWAVRESSPKLAEAIDSWAQDTSGKRVFRAVSKRYFEFSKRTVVEDMPLIRDGHISPFDDIFRKYAPILGWDWQLLAAISYQESHFNPDVVSWAGAEGIMGIMPNTARGLGVTPHELKEPDVSVRTGVEALPRFRQAFSAVIEPEDKMKFTLAAYNAGVGHIYDAQRLAGKYGKNPYLWDDNVAEYVRLKSEPEYYNDPESRNGYLRGSETFNYVTEVIERYHYYKSITE